MNVTWLQGPALSTNLTEGVYLLGNTGCSNTYNVLLEHLGISMGQRRPANRRVLWAHTMFRDTCDCCLRLSTIKNDEELMLSQI